MSHLDDACRGAYLMSHRTKVKSLLHLDHHRHLQPLCPAAPTLQPRQTLLPVSTFEKKLIPKPYLGIFWFSGATVGMMTLISSRCSSMWWGWWGGQLGFGAPGLHHPLGINWVNIYKSIFVNCHSPWRYHAVWLQTGLMRKSRLQAPG